MQMDEMDGCIHGCTWIGWMHMWNADGLNGWMHTWMHMDWIDAAMNAYGLNGLMD
jgi:hypothetical protein